MLNLHVSQKKQYYKLIYLNYKYCKYIPILQFCKNGVFIFFLDQNTAGSVAGDALTDQQSSTPLPSGVPENVQVNIYMHWNMHLDTDQSLL